MNYQTHNPDQMLRLASVDPYSYSSKLDYTVKLILALFATAKADDSGKIVSKLEEIISECSRVSIGTCLDRLNSVASVGNELDGDHDGLDALCYHLGGDTVVKAQQSLRKIMQRFSELSKEQEEKTRQQKEAHARH